MNVPTRSHAPLPATLDCGCASGACKCSPDVCHQSPFCRPRFFAGQLLTEEDLDLLVDYVVGKNRLRNRYLFGSGVVCGLAVTCHPCGGGVVVVSPGYAIDCCGNDIYLPCPEEVDINALVRELRLRELEGYDCGDPCADETKGKQRTDDTTRRYCLYLRYAEDLSEPVAPYLDDEPCGAVQCEPTRVCEGYRFELHCVDHDDAPLDISDRIAECIGALPTATRFLRTARVSQARAGQLQTAVAAMNVSRAANFTQQDVANAVAARDRLSEFVGRDDDTTEEDEGEFRLAVAHYQIAATTVARLRALPEARRKEVLAEFDELQIAESELPELIGGAGPRIRERAAAALEDPEAREDALINIELAERFASPNATPETFTTTEAQLYLNGAAVKMSQVHKLQLDAVALKSWLLDRLERSTNLTSCDLIERLKAIRLDEEFTSRFDGAQVNSVSAATLRVILILLDFLRDCVCLALNPVCADCKDPKVLLACLDVRDCDVIDICNMDRRFVLSPAALRYWLPPLGSLGKLIERLCCELQFELPRQDSDPASAAPYDPNGQFITRSMVRAPTVSALGPQAVFAADALGVDTARVDAVARVGAELGAIARGGAPARLREGALTVSGAVLEAPEVQRRVGEIVDARVRETEAVLMSEVDRRLASLRRAQRKGRAEAADLEALREENSALRADVNQLREIVESLQG